MKVQNMQSSRGNIVPNQFEIYADNGIYFQSYSTIIAFKSYGGKVQLDKERWNYSKTTAKYRNLFLRMSTKEIEKAIDNGTIELTNLNR